MDVDVATKVILLDSLHETFRDIVVGSIEANWMRSLTHPNVSISSRTFILQLSIAMHKSRWIGEGLTDAPLHTCFYTLWSQHLMAVAVVVVVIVVVGARWCGGCSAD